jgi:hypothetical protein
MTSNNYLTIHIPGVFSVSTPLACQSSRSNLGEAYHDPFSDQSDAASSSAAAAICAESAMAFHSGNHASSLWSFSNRRLLC